jgi:threonine/homoserine/homoserine lactone efflux protein
MSASALSAFTLVALVAVLTPGLDTMTVLRNVVTSGRRGGLAAGLGVSAGCLAWGVASIAGLTALLTASRIAYTVVHVAGAAYLLWLGGSALWRSIRHPEQAGSESAPVSLGSGSAVAAFRRGLVTNLLNPKVGVFYLSLLPQFLPTGPGSAGWGVLLVAIHIGLGQLWLTLIVMFAAKAHTLLARVRARRWLDRITATILIGIGVSVAVETG